jgi:ABC-type glycerol-3-phosphate transport system permease component
MPTRSPFAMTTAWLLIYSTGRDIDARIADAGLVIATVPVIVLFLITTKQIVEGLTVDVGR